jgi:CheY-like chemotaxis protein
MRGGGAGRGVNADGKLRACVQPVLEPRELVEQVALDDLGRRVGDSLEADENGSDALPQARDGDCVRLPLASPHGPFHAGPDDTRLHSGAMVAQDRPAVVVADDDGAMRMLCRVNLELEGYRVLEADSGDELERLLGAEDEVALLLLDIHLGDRDGMDIARSLRKTRPEIPIAFLTGSGLYSREDADIVGDATIRKPFTLEELTSTVSRLAQSERSAAPPTQ